MKNNLKICQINPKTKEIVNIFENTDEASKILKIDRSKLFIALSNRTWKFIGYHWQYYDDYLLKNKI